MKKSISVSMVIFLALTAHAMDKKRKLSEMDDKPIVKDSVEKQPLEEIKRLLKKRTIKETITLTCLSSAMLFNEEQIEEGQLLHLFMEYPDEFINILTDQLNTSQKKAFIFNLNESINNKAQFYRNISKMMIYCPTIKNVSIKGVNIQALCENFIPSLQIEHLELHSLASKKEPFQLVFVDDKGYQDQEISQWLPDVDGELFNRWLSGFGSLETLLINK